MLKEETIKKGKYVLSINSLEEEIDYVWNMMYRMKRLNKFGYKLSLPETQEMSLIINKALHDELEINDKETVRAEISKVYNSNMYEEAFEKTKECLESVEEAFEVFEYYKDKWGLKIFDEYLIKITQFGPGGSYNPDTGKIIMKRSNCIGRPAEVIVHETFHICIEENIIEKYNIPHEFKERIVDKFLEYHFKSILPEHKLQRVGNSMIDEYLSHEDSWINLPYYVERFKEEQLKSIDQD